MVERSFGWLLGALVVFLPQNDALASWSSRGEVALESRVFPDDSSDLTVDQGIGMFGRLQVDHRSKPFRERLRVYGRLDREDRGRSVLVIEEAWVEWKAKPFRIRAGVDLLNWTATEAFHPADIINSRNLDSSIQNYDKIGEPMVSISYKSRLGVLTAYHMPTVMDPILPSPASRLSFTPGLQTDFDDLDAKGERNESFFAPQFALRWNKGFDDFDVSVHVVHHVDRAQPTIAMVDNQPTALLQTLTQVGGTYQYVLGAWILKFEGGWRLFEDITSNDNVLILDGSSGKPDHGRLALGLEYGLSHETGSESTLLIEGQSVVGVSRAEALTLDPFQGDALVGYRYAFNDVQSTSLLVSAIVDVESWDEVIVAAQFTRRLGDTWTLNGSLRWVDTPEPSQEMGGSSIRRLRESDFLGLSLTRHF